MNYDLVKEFPEEGLFLEYENPVEGDKEFQKSVFVAAPHNFTVDEWRELGGKEPVPNGKGDVFMVSPMLIPVSSPSEELDFINEPDPEPSQIEAALSEPDKSILPRTKKMNEQETKAKITRIKTIAKALDMDKIKQALNKHPLKKVIVPQAAKIVQHYGEAINEEFKEPEKTVKNFDFTSPEVIEFLRNKMINRISGIEDTTFNQIKNILIQGEMNAWTPEVIAQKIENAMDIGDRVRAWTIARTETVRAANFGNFEAGKQLQVGHKEWLAVMDGRTRDQHQPPLDGQVVEYNDYFITEDGHKALYPGDFGIAALDINCLPGNVSVFNTKKILNTTKRWYDGKLVTISTASGINLTCTLNHPVLTLRGWVACDLLKKGDKVISANIRRDIIEPANPQNIPAIIEKVYSFAEVDRLSQRVPGNTEQFHGDGKDGYVDIINMESELMDRVQSASDKGRAKVPLTNSSSTLSSFEASASLGNIFDGSLTPSDSIVGSGNIDESFFGSHPLHSDKHSIRPIPDFNSRLNESGSDCGSSDIILFGKSLFGDTADIIVDEIISVDVSSFSGHVYNLHTVNNAYIATNAIVQENVNQVKGIITHNCRCTMLPVVGGKSAYNTIEKRIDRFKAHDRQRARFELRMRRSVRKVFAKQKKAVLAAIKEGL